MDTIIQWVFDHRTASFIIYSAIVIGFFLRLVRRERHG